MLNWLSDAPIETAPMGPVYDTLHIGDAPPLQLSRTEAAQKLDLKDRFVHEAEAIDAWYEAGRQARETIGSVVQTRAMPKQFGAGIKWWKRSEIERWAARTTAEVAHEITDNKELAAVLTSQWADFGGRPSTASFAMHAIVVGSYLESGGWYPVGGASAIAEQLLPTIRSAGGEARTAVTVASLLTEDGRVVGVVTADDEKILAKKVVSDIGARETVDRLLPEGLDADDWANEIRSLGSNICHYSLFLGFEGDIEAAGATKSNHWLYPTKETDVVWLDMPGARPGPTKRYAGEIIAWSDWSTIKRWADVPRDERGEAYTAFKTEAGETLFAQFRSTFPQLAEMVVFRELATPLATASITGHVKGSFYGLNVTPKRLLSNALQAKTPVKGLYLSGQDVVSPGVMGAMWGGLFCAASIDPMVFAHLAG